MDTAHKCYRIVKLTVSLSEFTVILKSLSFHYIRMILEKCWASIRSVFSESLSFLKFSFE